MLNKKDPLIESVQKIMLENEIRRTVTNNLNEELGIQSINNLPHELHEKYTAILEQNITAALLGEKVEMSKKQFANLDGKPEFTGRDLELARAGHHKKLAAAGKLEELKTDPYAEKDAGHDVVTPVEPKVNRAGKGNNLAPGMARAENIAKQGDSVVTRTGKNSSSVLPSTMKEEITGKTDIGDAIKDFRASKSKQLAGRSSEERRKAAIAAVLQARREKK
jgi:hypothetical protein